MQTSVNRSTVTPVQNLNSRPRVDSMAYQQQQVPVNTQPMQPIYASQSPARSSNKFSFSYQGNPHTSQLR